MADYQSWANLVTQNVFQRFARFPIALLLGGVTWMGGLASGELRAGPQPPAGLEQAVDEASEEVAAELEAAADPAVGGGEQPVPEDTESKQDANREQRRGKRVAKVRLPNFFSKLVNPQQRTELEALAKEFDPKIEAAEAEVARLKAERERAEQAILSADQRTELEKLREAAKSKRQAASAKRSALYARFLEWLKTQPAEGGDTTASDAPAATTGPGTEPSPQLEPASK